MTPDEYYEAKDLIDSRLDIAHAYLFKMFNKEGGVVVVACAQMICDRAVAQGTTLEEVNDMMKAAYRNSEQRLRMLYEEMERLDEYKKRTNETA